MNQDKQTIGSSITEAVRVNGVQQVSQFADETLPVKWQLMAVPECRVNGAVKENPQDETEREAQAEAELAQRLEEERQILAAQPAIGEKILICLARLLYLGIGGVLFFVFLIPVVMAFDSGFSKLAAALLSAYLAVSGPILFLGLMNAKRLRYFPRIILAWWLICIVFYFAQVAAH